MQKIWQLIQKFSPPSFWSLGSLWSMKNPASSNEERALRWVESIQGLEFEKLKKDIFRIIISTYYQKKFGPLEDKMELSIYDIARSEKDLIRLNEMKDEDWRKVIQEMVLGTLEIMNLFEEQKFQNGVRLKVALINIPVLRRASFKIV